MEDHDGAYYAWKQAGLKDKILLHFDAHMDFNWIAPHADSLLQQKNFRQILNQIGKNPFWTARRESNEERVNLGNYIHEAIQTGIVREFIWVYPDSPAPEKQFQAVGRLLRALGSTFPDYFQAEQNVNGRFKGLIYEIPFQALPYSGISQLKFSESVLLDIDLDFLIVQSLDSKFYPFTDVRNPGFWLSPCEFHKNVSSLEILPEMVTLAYSVEEGYTPLTLKYLGKELAARLSGTFDSESDFPDEAATHFQFALLALEKGNHEKARLHYQKAIECDPSYRTAYNHPGPVLAELGFYEEADHSYAQMQLLDPGHPAYRLYEIKKLVDQKKWSEALLQCKDQVALGEICLIKVKCLMNLKRFQEAWRELANYKEGKDYLDDSYFHLKAKLAEKIGKAEEAIEAHYGLIQRWMGTASAHYSLSRLYFFKGNLYKAKRHLIKGLQVLFLAPVIRNFRRLGFS